MSINQDNKYNSLQKKLKKIVEDKNKLHDSRVVEVSQKMDKIIMDLMKKQL
ncbi:MAG: Spo0E family sporulation regulatory protein-aspartic acid phosphatase [Halanaerobiales bacterium]